MLDSRAVGQVRPEAESPSEKAYECMVSQEGLSVRGRFKRQPHVKLCAIRTRAEVDFSVMTFDDDPVADNQAESRAGSALGREEGQRKDVGPGLWRDSTAIVRDLNEKKLAVAARADIDATRPADGVNRIVDEVGPDLV